MTEAQKYKAAFNFPTAACPTGKLTARFSYEKSPKEAPDWYVVDITFDGLEGEPPEYTVNLFTGKMFFDTTLRRLVTSGCYGIVKTVNGSEAALTALDVAMNSIVTPAVTGKK